MDFAGVESQDSVRGSGVVLTVNAQHVDLGRVVLEVNTLYVHLGVLEVKTRCVYLGWRRKKSSHGTCIWGGGGLKINARYMDLGRC